MTLRLVSADWGHELTSALKADSNCLRIVCPFIKNGALTRLLALAPKSVQVITRFNLNDFAAGVSDIQALRQLLAYGATVRGIKRLHAKMYLFGTSCAIVTSANLTTAALDRNPEFGVVTHSPDNVNDCLAYFSALWSKGGADLALNQLDEWEKQVISCRANFRPTQIPTLPDFGADAGLPSAVATIQPLVVSEAPQAFVKFLGSGANRVPLTFQTLEEVDRADCHRVLGYPASKRPTSVESDALMFIGRLTDGANGDDIRVFGRAVALRYQSGRDDATRIEIEARRWKKSWPRYIRVHSPQFVAGTMENGVSLNQLMTELGKQAFAATQRNAQYNAAHPDAKPRNVNPRTAYRQQPAVELSSTGCAWLADRLQQAFDIHGTIPADALARIE